MSSALVPRAPIRRTLRRLRPLGFVVVGLALVVLVVATFVNVDTNWLWFDSVNDSSEYARRLLTQVVMFVIFGGVTALGTGAVTWVAARVTPGPESGTLPWIRAKWRALSPTVRRLLLVAVPTVAGLRAGFAAAAHWQLWLLWRNGVDVGRTDPRFHRDYGYYLFDYPFHRYIDSVLISIVTIGLVTLIVVGYLRGAVRIRGARPRTTPGFRRALAVVLAVLALLKAGSYWLDRIGTVTSNRGPVTGQSWTDLHVVLPMKLVLIVVALALVVVFSLSAARRSLGIALAGVATMIVAGVVLGGIVPALFQTFAVKPSAVTAEATSIDRNIVATRYGFGLNNVLNTPLPSGSGTDPKATSRTVAAAVQPRLIDPNVVSATVTQQQQRTSYYRFKPTLDVDRYPIDGQSTDVVIGVRELRQSGLPRQTWTNQHLVYTHGIGVVAAPMATDNKGLPSYVEAGIPSTGSLGSHLQDRIYFGQYSPSYSIVGAPAGQGKEFDQPGEAAANYSYSAKGGVPIASVWHRLLYALRFGDKNILFASGFNPDSQLLYLRNPAARVKMVAPWLTLDGDVYPVVAGGHITWIADGYTTSSTLPDSQQVNLRAATTTTYSKYGASTAQPSTPVNYIRNSVVATVDAYTGAVRLYQKPGAPSDPVLQAWTRAFPGLVQPSSDIPSDLLPHLRYPQDLFNLQRSVITRYHVNTPGAFYSGQQFWRVPSDPTAKAVAQPSYYATMNVAGQQHFALTTPLLTNNRKNIAAYLTVDCDENSPGFGRLMLQTIPSSVATESPAQLRNDIETDPTIAQLLSVLRVGAITVKLGNLQTVTVGGQVLAIEPIYTVAKTGPTYPVLSDVAVIYGTHRPGFAANFPDALAEALGVTSTSGSKAALLSQAQQDLSDLTSAQASGDTTAAAAAQHRLATVLAQLAR